MRRLAPFLNLETMLSAGAALVGLSLAAFTIITWRWSATSFAAPPNVLPVVLTGVAGATGLQTIFGGFVLAIVGGHNAQFFRGTPAKPVSSAAP
jgi:hypothetical protein